MIAQDRLFAATARNRHHFANSVEKLSPAQAQKFSRFHFEGEECFKKPRRWVCALSG
jgi:hypothetical protein